MSDEQKLKLRLKALENYQNPELRKKTSISTKLAMQNQELRKKLSDLKKGTTLSEETRQKMSTKQKGHVGFMLGKHHTLETRMKISDLRKGEKSHLWKGGITEKNQKIRTGIEYRLWRESVFARDNWTCQECGKRGNGDLNAHHIKEFSNFPELRFAIDNGTTLCRICHKKTENYGRKAKGLIRGSA